MYISYTNILNLTQKTNHFLIKMIVGMDVDICDSVCNKLLVL